MRATGDGDGARPAGAKRSQRYSPGISCPGYSAFCPVCPVADLIPASCTDPACRARTYWCPDAERCPCMNEALRPEGFAGMVQAWAAAQAREERIDVRARRRRAAVRDAAYGAQSGLERGYQRFCERRKVTAR